MRRSLPFLFLPFLFLWSSLVFGQVEKIGKESFSAPLQEFLYEEQVLHNKGLWPKNSFDTNVHPEYFPENRPKFPLPYYLIEEGDARFLEAHALPPDLKGQLTAEKDGKNYYKLFVHPDSEDHYQFLKGLGVTYISPKETEFLASPTSSFRTLLVWNPTLPDKTPFMAKVSLDKNIIGGIDRLVSENEVQRSVGNQRAFDQIGSETMEESQFDVFPEPAGLVLPLSLLSKAGPLTGKPEKLGGQLIRTIPDSIMKGDKRWISLAAMMSPNREGPPLVMDIIQKTGKTTVEFIEEYLTDSFLFMVESIGMQKGMTLEPHAQNLLFETDRNLLPTKNWVMRDFGGIWPDGITMIEKGGPLAAYAGGPMESYKFTGGRGNQISSVVNFYKRQVFDFMLKEIKKHDPSLTEDEITRLSENFQRKFLVLMNHYLHLKETDLPTMGNYKKIIKKIEDSSTFIDPTGPSHQILPDDSWIKDFFWEKVQNGQYVDYFDYDIKRNDLDPSEKGEIHAVPSALYLKFENFLFGFVPLTSKEQQEFYEKLEKSQEEKKKNKGELICKPQVPFGTDLLHFH